MQDYERVARQGEQPRPQSYQHVSSATSTHHGCGSDSHPAFSDTVPTSHTAGSRQDQNNLDPMEGSSTASARRPVPQRTSQRSRRYDAEDITDKPSSTLLRPMPGILPVAKGPEETYVR
ncbi:hypothetical protein LTR28_004352 [Elasticomyces elasticus]|nr:hypothetical protein LTR28_004352 [Elasticomyces elasticus]